ncbi:MAG: O-antigen ligase family protein [Saprospirales bacterium]|nr:O-antigen ligase family protein [Saprospirales bacterium]
MQLLLFGILALGALWIWASRHDALKAAALATAGSLALFLIPLLLLPTTRHRFQRLLHPTDNVRMQTWGAAGSLIAQHPLLGVGTGDFTEKLYETYRSKAYLTPLKDKLNAHNQYLQTAATIGSPAAFFWILCLAWPFAWAWKEKKSRFLWFLVLFALSNLTESMLETQRGTMFYGFFNSLFLAEILKDKTTGFFSE